MLRQLTIGVLFFTLINHVNAQAPMVSGWVEHVMLVSSRTMLQAKLDTGAKTSSIHAKNIKTYNKEGQSWVAFDMPNENGVAEHFVSKVVRTVLIKRHNLPSARRFVVELPICMNGEIYEAEFTLSNRENYIYPVLLGRTFLKNKFIINPAKKFRLKQTKGCKSEH